MSEDKRTNFKHSIENAKLSIGKIIDKLVNDTKGKLGRLETDLNDKILTSNVLQVRKRSNTETENTEETRDSEKKKYFHFFQS